ncbi:hypothetical protein [Labrenzia sp. DG1229]|uniref:hypothetical protein n=1 Tax=Labrenzia sp. DG1229 TaxID=681847 RepID=UPI00048CD372|nr:hypothetical protein [Labrenzia sp. DG1229]
MTSKKDRPRTSCTQIATVQLLGQKSKCRHVAETDDGRLVILESSYASDEPGLIGEPFTVASAIDHAERVLAGSAPHITHKMTPLVLASALLAMAATITGFHEPAKAEGEDNG